ncbi:hypothetical protein [Streptomyces sp. MZ04]|uniref:hypothetical protein n=1 Tax=Streptomyces sp. MZ04 TaxID=2559236 RepID=UPI001AE04C55|nr:hypothetical protein [Streptomyces sp. MZ04]
MNSPPPERYQRYAAPAGQRRHVVQPLEIELYGEHDPVVYVPNAYGEMVPMRKSQAPVPMQAPPPRDLTPQPLFDPLAQRMAGAGIGAGSAGAGIGWGIGQAAAGIATIGTTTAVVAMLALWLLARAGGRVVNHVHNETHNHVQQKWLGRTSVTNVNNQP